jgi:hypothetical protein
MDKTAVELLAVQLVENEDVRIWSKGLGPFTDMAQSALQRKRSKKAKSGSDVASHWISYLKKKCDWVTIAEKSIWPNNFHTAMRGWLDCVSRF